MTLQREAGLHEFLSKKKIHQLSPISTYKFSRLIDPYISLNKLVQRIICSKIKAFSIFLDRFMRSHKPLILNTY